jgi:hypothetical protein
MFRHLFTLLSALSLLLCLSACVVWIRSYVVSDSLYTGIWHFTGILGDESAWWLLAGRGGVGIGHRTQTTYESARADSASQPVDQREYACNQVRPARPLDVPGPAAGILRRLGFRYENDPMDGMEPTTVKGYYREWDTPLWIVCLLFAWLPALWLRGHQKRKRASAIGRCAECGYDLRATPTRCPECGAVPAASGNGDPTQFARNP